MDKNEARKAVKGFIKTMDSDKRNDKDKVIYEKVYNCPTIKKAKSIGIYHSSDWEVNTRALIYTWLRDGKEITIPRIEDDKGLMTMREITTVSFEKEKKNGIEQPIEKSTIVLKDDIEIMIIPVTAFDINKNRIGQGGGYYDRYLQDFKGVIVCLAYDLQKLKEFKPDKHDIVPTKIMTEKDDYK